MDAERQVELLSDAVWQTLTLLNSRGLEPRRRERAKGLLEVGLQMAELPATDPERWGSR